MSQLIVTTGKRYSDIDGLACVIGYQEVPTEQKPLVVIVGPLNNSISLTIRKWPMDYKTSLPAGDYEFVVTDISEFNEFPVFVKKEKMVEIYDHHFGFEKTWQDLLGAKAKIEPVGACATLIWEEFTKRNPGKKMSWVAANLLYTAIVSNTLNFQASITTERDKDAFLAIRPFTDLPKDWISVYYQEQEVNVYANAEMAVVNDTKIQYVKGIRCAVGQIELWNSRDFVKEFKDTIEAVLRSFEAENWFFVSPSIGEGRTYIYTKSESIKNLLRSSLQVDFFGSDIGATKKPWLRKEILKKIQ